MIRSVLKNVHGKVLEVNIGSSKNLNFYDMNKIT